MIIFVGDKPSLGMKPGAAPFEGAKCEQRLNFWIHSVLPLFELDSYEIINQCDYKPFFPDDFLFHKIVALGQVASNALTRSGIPHFKLPHPSGRNRQLNDKAFISQKLEECKKWISSQATK